MKSNLKLVDFKNQFNQKTALDEDTVISELRIYGDNKAQLYDLLQKLEGSNKKESSSALSLGSLVNIHSDTYQMRNLSDRLNSKNFQCHLADFADDKAYYVISTNGNPLTDLARSLSEVYESISVDLISFSHLRKWVSTAVFKAGKPLGASFHEDIEYKDVVFNPKALSEKATLISEGFDPLTLQVNSSFARWVI